MHVFVFIHICMCIYVIDELYYKALNFVLRNEHVVESTLVGIYIFIYVYLYIYIYIYMHVFVFIHICMCIYVIDELYCKALNFVLRNEHVVESTLGGIYVFIYVYLYIYLYICIYILKHVFIHICMCMYMYIYIHIYI
jgi:hypothetical protein